MAISAEDSPNAIAYTRLTLMPESLAAFRFCDTARIALPILENFINRSVRTITATLTERVDGDILRETVEELRERFP